MIFGVLNPEKIDMKILQICPPHLSRVATLPWEIRCISCQSTYARYCIQLISPYRQPQNVKQSYRRTKRRRKQNKEVGHSRHSQRYWKDMGLHLTDIYMNCLQNPFLDAKYFRIKFCRLFSATCFADRHLNNCTRSTIVPRDFCTTYQDRI